MNRGTEFKGQGVATSSKEGLWVLTEDSDPLLGVVSRGVGSCRKKSGWVLVDGSKLGRLPRLRRHFGWRMWEMEVEKRHLSSNFASHIDRNP